MSELEALRARMIAAASSATAFDPTRFQQGTLYQHCGAVAKYLQIEFGWTPICGEVGGEQHWWVSDCDGNEIDLTGDQYGGDGLHPVTSGTAAELPDSYRLLAFRLAVDAQA